MSLLPATSSSITTTTRSMYVTVFYFVCSRGWGDGALFARISSDEISRHVIIIERSRCAPKSSHRLDPKRTNSIYDILVLYGFGSNASLVKQLCFFVTGGVGSSPTCVATVAPRNAGASTCAMRVFFGFFYN